MYRYCFDEFITVRLMAAVQLGLRFGRIYRANIFGIVAQKSLTDFVRMQFHIIYHFQFHNKSGILVPSILHCTSINCIIIITITSLV